MFIAAGLVAFLVYRFGRSVMHHALLAAITAVIVGGVGLVTATATLGLLSLFITSNGAIAAAAAVFPSLVLTIAIHRHRRTVRSTMVAAAATTGTAITVPRMPLGVIVPVAGLAAGLPQVVVAIARSSGLLTDPRDVGFVPDPMLSQASALSAVVAVALVAGWAVLIVLLVDQWVAPRLVRALIAGVFAAVALTAPLLVSVGGLEYGGEAATWVLLSVIGAVAAAVVVAVAERRTVPAAIVADPDAAATRHPLNHP